ncbi:hypothetical protein V8J82_07875 [Gymnodinialimonas sp. 2305UL16-5]|uniref:SecDF P1 head subdomain-containing protein n=1 Tax=Gymnodinialimonas mytili TaxID=3126503 RepID=UPI00309D15BA
MRAPGLWAFLICALSTSASAQDAGPLRLNSPSDSIEVGSEDLVDAWTFHAPPSGQPAVGLRFSADVADWVAQETSQHVGEIIEIAVCGRVVTAPVIQTPITAGEIAITGSFTIQEAQDLLDAITGEGSCGPIS